MNPNMNHCTGGTKVDFLLPFFEWDELDQEQKQEVKNSVGKWLGADIVNYSFGKGKRYGQTYWIAHPKLKGSKI